MNFKDSENHILTRDNETESRQKPKELVYKLMMYVRDIVLRK